MSYYICTAAAAHTWILLLKCREESPGLYTRGQRRIIKMQIEIPNDDSREGPVC